MGGKFELDSAAVSRAADAQAAVELEQTLDAWLDGFTRDNAVLLRRACGVPDGVRDLTHVTECTVLGHVLGRLIKKQGRPTVEALVENVLTQFEAVLGMPNRPGVTH